jgi:hypothetical protein
MDTNKSKLIFNDKTSNDRQTLILTIIGIVLAAMQVLTGVSENQPRWQLILTISLAVLTLILIVSLWIPRVYYGLWLRSKRKILRGIYSQEKKSIKIELIEIIRKTNFDYDAVNNYEKRREVDFTYSMQFEKDFRFLTIKFAFQNEGNVELHFESKAVELGKKGERLFLDFDFNNSRQVTENIHENQNIPFVFGSAQMIFSLKTKKLTKIIFNQNADIMTLAYIGV